jgi:hypothetical protein
MDSVPLRMDLTLPYVGVTTRIDGTWSEIPECAWTRRFPEQHAILLEEYNRTGTLVLNEDHTNEITPRTQPNRFGNPEQWEADHENFYKPEVLERIKAAIEEAPLIVEHWYLFGGSAPKRVVFDGFEELVNYLHEHTKPGDLLYCWDFSVVCPHGTALAAGKVPDEAGRGFKGGAY